VATVSGVSDSNQQAATNAVKKILGKDDFLKLLITQLKYQDPMEPTNNQDFIAQMAQFSSLEQMTNMGNGFQKLAESQDAMLKEVSFGQAVNLIGRTVSANISANQITGVVTGTKQVDGLPYVTVNGKDILVQYIQEIKQTVPAVTASNP
jgi:flagellar basal-body rod modification protein FlgD